MSEVAEVRTIQQIQRLFAGLHAVNWQPRGSWALQSPADPNCHTEIGHYTSSRLPVAAAQSQQKAVAYKATAYAVKGGCAQLACRDDQSDTTTIPQRGAPLPASGSPVLYSSARPFSCIRATNCRVAFQQSIALCKGQSPACVPPSCRVRPFRWHHRSGPYGQLASFA